MVELFRPCCSTVPVGTRYSASAVSPGGLPLRDKRRVPRQLTSREATIDWLGKARRRPAAAENHYV